MQKVKKIAGALALALMLLCVFCWPCPIPAYAIDVIGEAKTFTTASALSKGNVVYINASGYAAKCDADGSSTYPAYGIAIADASSGGIVGVAQRGTVQGDSGLTTNGVVYISATAGSYSQTPTAANPQPIGIAISTTSWKFDINGQYLPTMKTATGNQVVTGTLDVTGAVGIDGNFDVNTNKCTINATSGDMTIAGNMSGVNCTFSGPATLQSNVTITGDIKAGGGFIIPIKLYAADIDSNDTDVACAADSPTTSIYGASVRMPWAGSIVGISVDLKNVQSAGTLTVWPSIDGTKVSGFSKAISTAVTSGSTTQAKDVAGSTFSAGAVIGAIYTGNSSWQPDNDLAVITIWVETGGAS